MCATAVILASAALVSSAVGTAATISSASANKKMARYQADLEKKQLDQEAQIAAAQAAEQEVARLDEFNRTRAANLAAIAASGVGQNISFLQGTAAAEEDALGLDIRNLRLGLLSGQNRIADQIKVNRLSRQVAGINATNQTIGAVSGLIGSAANAYNFATNYKTPSATTTPTSTGGTK